MTSAGRFEARFETVDSRWWFEVKFGFRVEALICVVGWNECEGWNG